MAHRMTDLAAPAALFAGVLLFAVSLLVLGIEATGEEPHALSPSSLTAANGTAALVYPAADAGVGSRRIEVDYAFNEGSVGDAYVLDCKDLERVRRGEAPTAPLLAFTRARSGSFVVEALTLPSIDACDRAVAFVWSVPGDDPTVGRPETRVDFYYGAFDAGRYWLLLGIMGAGAFLALVGGLGWLRGKASARLPVAEQGPLEVLRAALDRAGEQLERTRKHLLFAGVLGVFLWYPILIPWAWSRAKLTSENPLFAWGVAGLTLAFLLVLTLLWGREIHRLDRELAAWRARMTELRERENGLLETL